MATLPEIYERIVENTAVRLKSDHNVDNAIDMLATVRSVRRDMAALHKLLEAGGSGESGVTLSDDTSHMIGRLIIALDGVAQRVSVSALAAEGVDASTVMQALKRANILARP